MVWGGLGFDGVAVALSFGLSLWDFASPGLAGWVVGVWGRFEGLMGFGLGGCFGAGFGL